MIKTFINKEVIMEMQLDVQKLKKLRESKAWSQSYLADVSGISLRTIQRIEKSGVSSQESAKSICSAYDILITDIIVNETIQADVEPTFLSVFRGKFEKMNKKSTFISFSIAFIIAYIWTAY
jgi:transcriptional regulator with XRE-family HTH domain